MDGCEAFAEDRWGTFKIGDLQFHGVKLCARCTVSHGAHQLCLFR